MKKRIGKMLVLILPALLIFVFVECAAGAGRGQGYGQGQQAPPKAPAQPGQAATAPAEPPAPPVNAEEEAAYKAFYEAKPTEIQSQIQLGEEFLKKFPESRYREGIYSRLTGVYLTAGQEDKMFAAGEKALELNANNVDVLSLMAMVLSRRATPGALDADQKLQKSERYSTQAINLLTTIQKPEALSEEDFTRAKNDKLSMCHSGLGFVHFHRQKFADSATALEQATKLASAPDVADFFVLGLAYHNTQRHADAVTVFERCAEAAGPLQERCKQGLEQAKKLAGTQLTRPKP